MEATKSADAKESISAALLPPPGSKDLSRIVCHRGLHDPDLLDPSRPVENSLGAYEKAWKHFDLCECDITASSDGTLFLCHDETYMRVLDPHHPMTHRFGGVPVSDLEASDIQSLRLLDGTRPTTLVEVLDKAKSFLGKESGVKKMVIELKKDAAADTVVKELGMLLTDRRPDFVQHVGVIMSFDVGMMKHMAEWRSSAVKAHPEVKSIQLMLLTEAPDHWAEANHTVRMDVTDLNFKSECLRVVKECGVDGVYLEYQVEMTEMALSLKETKWQEELRALSSKIPVGVWNYWSSQPDGLKTLDAFTSLGFAYINSDLPEDEFVFMGLADKPERDSCWGPFLSAFFCLNDDRR